MQAPSRLIFDNLLHGVEVFRWRQVVHFRHVGKLQAEFRFEFFLQRQIRCQILVQHPEPKFRIDGSTMKLDRNQQQRCVPRLVRSRRLVPFEESHRQVETVDTLFLVKTSRVVEQPQQPFLKLLVVEGRLQILIEMPIRNFVVVVLDRLCEMDVIF